METIFLWTEFVYGIALFLGVIFFSEMGRRFRLARLNPDSTGVPRGVGMAEGAVFGLLGLIIAFTFTGAVSRFQERRNLITEEANAIGTAYLRLDLMPSEAQPALRDLLRQYIDLRLITYLTALEDADTAAKLAQTDALQAEIWTTSVSQSIEPRAHPDAGKLLLPALNSMFDIRTTRIMATHNHPPAIVFSLLIGLSLTGAFLVGYGISTHTERVWLHTAVLAFVLALSLYLIIDLEYPRLGLFRVDDADQVLVDLRESMDQP
jgi:hypothetical protein